ncbi:hypothetical protein BY996DRAFT_6417579 [Phakopsora pachyrhizi]|nr:hypothetical protein BY996DRAFT_6417579 [Phakopsora pachyrhizi]
MTGDSIGGAASAVEVESVTLESSAGDEERAAKDETLLISTEILPLVFMKGDHDDNDDEDDEDGDNDEDDEDEDYEDDHDHDHDDHDVHNADLEIEIADRVGGSIGLPEALGHSNTMDEATRKLMSFLNSGPPDLGLQAGTSQILQAAREGADIEDALEDDEGVSIADQPNAVDDVFEGGSIDFGDDVVVDHSGGENRAEAAPWSWNGVLPFQPRGKIQTATGGMGSHHSLLHQATDNVFGRTRGGQQSAGIYTHPLLVEDSTAPTRGDGLNRSQCRMDIRSGSVDQWINAIENLIGGGAGQLIEQILGNVAYGQRLIHIDLGQGPNGSSLGGVVIDPQCGVVMPVGAQGLLAPTSQTTPTTSGLGLICSTGQKNAKEEIIEKDKQAKLAHEKRSISEQRTKSSTTATKNLPDDGTLSATQGQDTENVEEAASSGLTLLPSELPEPNSDSTATRAHTEDSKMHNGTAESGNELLHQSRQQESNNGTAINESTMQDSGMQDDVAEVMNLARQLAARICGSAEGRSDSSQTGSEAHNNRQSHAQANDAPIAASNSKVKIVVEGTFCNAAPERVTIMISGPEVDITNTGIDPTLLEALPEDMREEVLNQHFRERQPVREELSVPVPSSISTDLLDALPPEIQAEVIRSEVAAEERRRREEDLERRNQPLVVQHDEGFISTLPRNILAEVDALRDQMSRRHHAIRFARERDPLGGLSTTSGASQIGTSSKKTLVKADTVQVLDRSGIAALVRLMFFPQPLRRHSLQKVLVNLCENSRSHGTRDAATIDRSFSQVSSRAIKALVSPTPKSTGKLRREAHIGPLPQFPGESVPNLIALRCLEALSLLVTANDRVPIYFLTKQEVPVVLHKRSAKKGKGKEKSSTSVTYPLVGLFALLNRDSLLKQPNLTESITSLLALISRPLTALAKKLEDTKPQASGTSSLGALFLPVPEESTNLDSSSLSLNPSGGPMTSGDAPQGTISKKTETPSNVLEKAYILAPNDLRMIVNVLDSGECSSKTFSHTVTFMQALSTAPHGREVIAAELLERAQFLGEALLPDLDELAGEIKEAPNAAEVRSLTLAKFSSASAQQAKLLRILKTTEFLYAHPLTMTSNDLFSPSGPNPALVDPSAPKIRFRPLWEKLSHSLTLIQERDDMIHIATVLLPLMESFLVVCKRVGISSAKSHRGTQSPRLEDASLDVMTRFFLSFTESHRKVLNTMVRNNPGLMSGSFSILVHNPKVLSLTINETTSANSCTRLDHVNSMATLARRTGDELKYGKLSVRFYDEEGVDAGGVTREWLTILIKQMLDPNYALFTGSDTHSKTYQPNTASSLNPDNHGFFTFCGQVIEKETLPQWFEEARVFYHATLPSKNSTKIQHAVLALLVPWAKKISPLKTFQDSTALTRGDGLNRSQQQMDIHSGSVDQWINAIENLLGGGAGQLIEQILGNVAYGQRPIHIDLGQGPNGPSLGGVVIDPQRGVVMPVGPKGLQAVTSQTTPTSQLDRHLADRLAGQILKPLATLPRCERSWPYLFHGPKKNAKEEIIEKDKQAKLAHEKRSISEQRTKSSTTATKNLPDDGTLSATQGQDTENMEEAASSGLTLLPSEVPEPNSDSTTTRASTEDSEMHDGTAESGNELLHQSRQQESSNVKSLYGAFFYSFCSVQDDIAEVMNMARQLAARIGGSAEEQIDSSKTGFKAHNNTQSHVQANTNNQTALVTLMLQALFLH